jgi:hypothetical protein
MRTLKLTSLSEQFANPKGAAPRAVGHETAAGTAGAGVAAAAPAAGPGGRQQQAGSTDGCLMARHFIT